MIEIYPQGARLVRDAKGMPYHGVRRREIYEFSSKSKRNLMWAASNGFPPGAPCSQFGMTYHLRNPSGREGKRDLDVFLKALRRRFPGIRYLWILEFQTRGVVHFHLFIGLAHDTPGLHQWLGETWNRIAEPGNQEHLEFHRDRRQSFIPWKMGSGKYLSDKYLGKAAQKCIPEGFTGVGAFWRGSQGLVPPPVEIDADAAGGQAVWIPLVRTLCRHRESSFRKSKWKSRARRTSTSYRLQNGAAVARRLLADDQGGQENE